MARGVTARQPAKSGRQEGTRRSGRGQAAAAKSGARKNSRGIPRKNAAQGAVKVKTTASKAGNLKRAPSKHYNPIAPECVNAILKHLDALYPNAVCALLHRTAWELLVATILSAQSTDANVNRVTPILFEKYPTVQDFAALSPEQLEPDVRSTAFFRNKSKSVVGAAMKIVADFGGEVPQEMYQLLTLPVVARTTATVVVCSRFGSCVA